MTDRSPATNALNAIRGVRQTRAYTTDPVDPAALDEILEIARWSGSSANTQPWRFIVVDDPAQLQRLSEVRDAIGWVGTAPLAIAFVLDGNNRISEAYDEGRVTERIMIAAKLLGLASAVAWYGDADQQATAKAILDVPEEATARSLIAIGHPAPSRAQGSSIDGGRKALDEIVSHNRLGNRR